MESGAQGVLCGVTAVEGKRRGRTVWREKISCRALPQEPVLCLQGQRWETLYCFPASGQEGRVFIPLHPSVIGMWPLGRGCHLGRGRNS